MWEEEEDAEEDVEEDDEGDGLDTDGPDQRVGAAHSNVS